MSGWLSGSCDDVVRAGERALMKIHTPERPSWFCFACGDPWPCLVALVTLQYERLDLRAVMTGYMAEAKTDLGWPADALYGRFIQPILGGRPEPTQYGSTRPFG